MSLQHHAHKNCGFMSTQLCGYALYILIMQVQIYFQEMLFYKQSQVGAQQSIARLISMGIATERPEVLS